MNYLKHKSIVPARGVMLLLYLVLLVMAASCASTKPYGTNVPHTEIDGTYNTTKDPYYRVTPPRPPGIIDIYTVHTNKYLVGNDCMVEYTRSLGFEYVAWVEYPHEEMGPIAFHVYNLTSRIRLFFKAGPFWKTKVNRKLPECRRASGDFIGMVSPTDATQVR